MKYGFQPFKTKNCSLQDMSPLKQFKIYIRDVYFKVIEHKIIISICFHQLLRYYNLLSKSWVANIFSFIITVLPTKMFIICENVTKQNKQF